MSPKSLLTRTMFSIMVLVATFAFTGAAFAQDDSTVNYLRLGCPANVAAVAGTQVSIPVYIANSQPLGGYSVGFQYDSDLIDITSVTQGPAVVGGFWVTPALSAANNTILIGWADFSGANPVPVHAPGAGEAVAFTLTFTVNANPTNGCSNLFTTFLPPGGFFVFSMAEGGDIEPRLIDCSLADIVVGTGCPTNQPPNAVCQPINVAAGPNCTAAANVNNGSSDPDGDPITLVQNPAGPYPLGVTNVSLIVSDNHGASDTCQTTVTVVDQTDPVITCPAAIVVSNTAGQCGANVNFAAMATDNCDGSVAITYSKNPNTLFPVGTTQVTATATDDAGNFSQCQFNVTVNDTENPVAVCPANITVTAAAGENTAVVNFLVSATDNCPGATAVAVPASGSIFPLGTTTVNVTATDAHSHQGLCSFTVTVNAGNTAPVVSDIPNQTINQGESFATISLDDYVTDAENADNTLTWSVQTMKSLGIVTVSIDPVTHVATVSATPDFTGSAVFTFRATDPGLLFDEDQATFTVNVVEVNDPPVVSDIPDQTITAGGSFITIGLDNFVADPDNSDAQMTWTFSGNTQLGVVIDANRVATVTYPGGFTGAETITFTATDPGALFDSDAATFTVNAIANQPPVVSDIPDQSITEGDDFAVINLDDYVTDPNNIDADIVWSHTGSSLLTVTIAADRKATIVYPNGFSGSETITFTATDPGSLFASNAASFSVTKLLNPEVPVVVVNPGDPFQFTINVGNIAGIENGSLSLSVVSGLPAGATAAFAPNPVSEPGSSILSGTTSAGTAPGDYVLQISGNLIARPNGPVVFSTSVTLSVGGCTAAPIVVTDVDVFNLTVEEGSNPADELIYITNGAACGTLYWEVSSDQSWVTSDPQSGNVEAGETPGDALTLMFNTAALTAAGSPYTAHVQVSPVVVTKSRNANENGVITITLTVTEKPASTDTVFVTNGTAYPGEDVSVQVNFRNEEELAGMSAGLTWDSPDVTLDSVSYVGSRVDYIDVKIDTIINLDRTLTLGVLRIPPETLIPVGSGLWATLWFSVDGGAAPQVVTIDTVFIEPGVELVFNDENASSIYPQFSAGAITIFAIAENCISGLISDANGPLAGASVELWDGTGPIAFTTTDGYGNYEFCFMQAPGGNYTVRAYMTGHYPNSQGGVSLPDDAVNLVLAADAGEITPTYEWVDLYCQGSAYAYGELVPVGSVLEAFDPNGNVCGRWVFTTAGTFGFMPVYVDDPYSPEDDEGCLIGDEITLKLNGGDVDLIGDPLTWTHNGDRYEACFTYPAEGGDVTRCLHLNQGWNLVSLNVGLPTSDIEVLFADVMDNTDVILSFESVGLTYDPELPDFSTLFNVDNAHGYWFRMNADDSICFTGPLVAASTPIALEANWNLVSYLPVLPMAVPDALFAIWNSVVVVLGYENGGLSYDPDYPQLATLNQMKELFGYWIKTTSSGSLVYPDGLNLAPRVDNTPRTLASNVSGVQISNSWINAYGSNVKLDGETLPAGAKIEAFDNQGVLVGSYTVRQSGKYGFMPIYGPDNFSADNDAVANAGKISFKINGQDVDQKIDWTNNGDRVVLSAFTTVGKAGSVLPDQFSLAQNFPNPFNPETSIEYVLPKPGFVEVSVFNVMGAKVKTLVSDYQAAGSYSVKWYGNSDNGDKVASGVYFYKLTAGDFTDIRKMTLLK